MLGGDDIVFFIGVVEPAEGRSILHIEEGDTRQSELSDQFAADNGNGGNYSGEPVGFLLK